MKKTIFHVDVNSAFLSWSAVKLLRENPKAVDLRTVPSVVGGDPATRHGIVTAKSIPAKKYGIQTGEPVESARRKCPDLVIVRSDFKTYGQYSRDFIDILKKYTPLVQKASIDEAWIDVTGRSEDPVELAYTIRSHIRNELGFTVNIGISENKLLSKMASDFKKPDMTHTLFKEEIPDKLWPLPIGELFGCGPRTAQKLISLGFKTIGDVACAEPEVIISILGEAQGEYIYRSAWGEGSDTVHTEREEAKSYSNEFTTASDITESNYYEEMLPLLDRLSAKVALRLQRDSVYANTISVTVKTTDFKRRSMQKRLAESANDETVFKESARELMDKLVLGENGIFASGAGVRMVGVGAAGLDDGNYRQMRIEELI